MTKNARFGEVLEEFLDNLLDNAWFVIVYWLVFALVDYLLIDNSGSLSNC